AAGCTLPAAGLAEFRAAFESVARERLTPADLDERIDCDGALEAADMTLDFARLLRSHVWGQGFPEPRFKGSFAVDAQRVVGERHLKLSLAAGGRRFDAIRFGSAQSLPAVIDAVYRLDVNEYMGNSSLQLVVEHCA
ncbi:MAG TPA: single-stranded-DNA-specific exonuclease RecJ, partial [Usitatibacter sp.]|nr:single-stranded-DNA-specific exonuclease RecJ [Usitatibacter sp.]